MKKSKKSDLFTEIPLVIKEPKKKKSPNTQITKEFIKYYKERYREIFGISPKIECGKDHKLLNLLLKNYQIEDFNCETKLEFLIKACEKYFVIKDNLSLKTAWSIGVFYYNFGKIALLLRNSDKEVIEPIIEGYKLAYLNHTGNKLTDSLIGKEEIFSHIYLIIKPFWLKYGEDFKFHRFSELYFLVLLGYAEENFSLDFFTTKFAQDKFVNWLETEGKELIPFYPKNIGEFPKEKLEIEEKKMLKEEKSILYSGK